MIDKIRRRINPTLEERLEKIARQWRLSGEEADRLRSRERFIAGSVLIGQNEFFFNDSLGFLHSFEEIFGARTYQFSSENDRPTIIDCGSNIGLSILFFKLLYPKSEVYGFEADPVTFSFLKQNVENLKLRKTKIENSAVWVDDKGLKFHQEGSLAGSHLAHAGAHSATTVNSFRFVDFLNGFEFVDFLKFDIEGAEIEVLRDCRGALKNTKRIFVEYHSEHDSPQYLPEVLDILSSAGFKYYIKQASDWLELPFWDNHKDTEKSYFFHQLNIFAFK